jgi:hypothetical protein
MYNVPYPCFLFVLSLAFTPPPPPTYTYTHTNHDFGRSKRSILIAMSTPSKHIVENDTLSLGLSSPSKSAKEILVNADDIIENLPDLSDLVELEEEIEDASN